jgi:hypothetical protein
MLGGFYNQKNTEAQTEVGHVKTLFLIGECTVVWELIKEVLAIVLALIAETPQMIGLGTIPVPKYCTALLEKVDQT